jgi:hypothetical protein
MANQEEPQPVIVHANLPSQQSATAGPVIAAPHLPAMEKVGGVTTVQRNPLLPLMGAGSPIHTAGEGLMAQVPSTRPAPTPPAGTPQKPKAGVEGPGGPAVSDGYLRVEVHHENGKLSVIGMKEVPGPLALPSAVTRGYAYEVLIDDQQVALGSVPDVGLRRAFANRDVTGPQGKHYFVDVPSFDFFVRIPKGYVLSANLPKLNIVLHNVQDAPDRFTTLAPLAKQPGVVTVEAGRLAGIKLEQLPQVVRPQFEQILNENERLK